MLGARGNGRRYFPRGTTWLALQQEQGMTDPVDAFMEKVIAKNPAEPEFHQAVREVVQSVMPVVEANPAYRALRIMSR